MLRQVLDDIQDAFERGPKRAPLSEQSLNRTRPLAGPSSGMQGLAAAAGLHGSPDHSSVSFATTASGSVTGAAQAPGQGPGLTATPLVARGKHARAGSLGGGPRSVMQRTESASRHSPMQRQGSGSFPGALNRQGSWG